MTKKRVFAIVIAAALLFVVLFSALYITKNSVHKCSQDNCPVCEQLEICENTLQTLALAAVLIAAVLFVGVLRERVFDADLGCLVFSTPVSLKVKLSN